MTQPSPPSSPPTSALTTTPTSSTLTVAAQYEVAVQTAVPFISIRRSDWNRLRRELRQCDVGGSNWFENAGWAFVGAWASGTTLLIGLYASPPANIETWVKPTCWAFFAVTLVLAIVFQLVARSMKRHNKRTVDDIERDMGEIEDDLVPQASQSGSAGANP